MDFKRLIKFLFSKIPVTWSCYILSTIKKGKVQMDKGSFIHPTVHILGASNILVGQNSCISEGSWLNVNHRVENDVAIEIGSNCFIGKDNFFSSGKKITIRDYVLTTIGCRFIGSSHRIDDPLIPYIATGTTSNDSVYIGVNCFIGVGATVMGNVTIGHGSVIGAGAFVITDVPPFSIVVGNPARLIKRYSFSEKKWVENFSESDFEDGMLDETAYLSHLQSVLPQVNMPWLAAGRSMGDL